MSEFYTGRGGFFGIGIINVKYEINVGTLWRSAELWGAQFIFTIGRRYEPQHSDTRKSYRRLPLFHFKDFDTFLGVFPMDTELVCLETHGRPLNTYVHPARAVYLLGAEDGGVPKDILELCSGSTLWIETECCEGGSLNVATAGSVVMYHRYIQRRNL